MPDYFLNWRWLAPAAVVAALVEGNSIRATSRMTDVSKLTILKLLADLGTACADYHDRAVRNVPCKRVQADEVWSFVGAKQKNVVPEKLDVWGDLWTWTALDADTKLIVSYKVGPRRPPMAFELTFDLAARVASQNFQLTTDGLPWYAQAVEARSVLTWTTRLRRSTTRANQPLLASPIRERHDGGS